VESRLWKVEGKGTGKRERGAGARRLRLSARVTGGNPPGGRGARSPEPAPDEAQERGRGASALPPASREGTRPAGA
jgi:hypothetical protein